MRKIVYWVHTSIDGHIAGPNGEFDWPVMGPELSRYSEDLIDGVDTFLYGRKVWDLMSSYWPNAESVSDHPHDLAFAPIWRSMPKVVVSRTLTDPGWDTTVIGADLLAEVTELKSRPGKDILLTGGALLAAGLAAHGLLDEYHVAVHPVVLGGGPRVFPVTERLNPTLLETRVCDGRIAVLRYHA